MCYHVVSLEQEIIVFRGKRDLLSMFVLLSDFMFLFDLWRQDIFIPTFKTIDPTSHLRATAIFAHNSPISQSIRYKKNSRTILLEKPH